MKSYPTPVELTQMMPGGIYLKFEVDGQSLKRLNGALKAAMPALVHAARSIWLVPMQKAPTAIRVVRAFACGRLH